MEKDEILLPTKNGHPDWKYMNNYIEKISKKVNNKNSLILKFLN